MPADAAQQSYDRDAPKWNPFCNLQDSLSRELLDNAAGRSMTEVKAAVSEVAEREANPDYPLRLSIPRRVVRLRPEDVMRNLVDESTSFRSELLTLRLATLPALELPAGRL